MGISSISLRGVVVVFFGTENGLVCLEKKKQKMSTDLSVPNPSDSRALFPPRVTRPMPARVQTSNGSKRGSFSKQSHATNIIEIIHLVL